MGRGQRIDRSGASLVGRRGPHRGWGVLAVGPCETARVGIPTDLVRLSDYAADFVVDSNGHLDAVETITAEFTDDRHGIFRTVRTSFRSDTRSRASSTPAPPETR